MYNKQKNSSIFIKRLNIDDLFPDTSLTKKIIDIEDSIRKLYYNQAIQNISIEKIKEYNIEYKKLFTFILLSKWIIKDEDKIYISY